MHELPLHFNYHSFATPYSNLIKTMAHALLLLLFLTMASSPATLAGDPNIVSDFLLPPNLNSSNINANFFAFTGMRSSINADTPKNLTIVKATMTEFPALNGQSVSYAVLLYPKDSINPPHTHPRAAELLFLLIGKLDVGFVDTSGHLYTQTLHPGDLFVFPKGLVHFRHCWSEGPAFALSAFGSANAGTVSLPKTVFSSGIDDVVLAKSFETDVVTVEMIKNGLALPN